MSGGIMPYTKLAGILGAVNWRQDFSPLYIVTLKIHHYAPFIMKQTIIAKEYSILM